MWAKCEEYCRQQPESVLKLPSATAIATELLFQDADTAFAFGEGNDAARRLAKFVQKQALAGKELQQIIKGQMRHFEAAEKHARTFAYWHAHVLWPVREASLPSAIHSCMAPQSF